VDIVQRGSDRSWAASASPRYALAVATACLVSLLLGCGVPSEQDPQAEPREKATVLCGLAVARGHSIACTRARALHLESERLGAEAADIP
jgi:hypothetical protein